MEPVQPAGARNRESCDDAKRDDSKNDGNKQPRGQ